MINRIQNKSFFHIIYVFIHKYTQYTFKKNMLVYILNILYILYENKYKGVNMFKYILYVRVLIYA